jgi:hypothetical protein
MMKKQQDMDYILYKEWDCSHGRTGIQLAWMELWLLDEDRDIHRFCFYNPDGTGVRFSDLLPLPKVSFFIDSL